MSDALRLELVLADLRRKYAEDQPRDDHGRFSDGSGGGSWFDGSAPSWSSIRAFAQMSSAELPKDGPVRVADPSKLSTSTVGQFRDDHIVVNAAAWDADTPEGREVLLSHEAGHAVGIAIGIGHAMDVSELEPFRIPGTERGPNGPMYSDWQALAGGNPALLPQPGEGQNVAEFVADKAADVLRGQVDTTNPEKQALYTLVRSGAERIGLLPTGKSQKYSDDEPRDDHGRWTSGGGESGPDLNAVHAALYGEHTGTPQDPVPCGGDIDRAAQIIADGGNVTLAQPQEISTLLDRMQSMVQEAQAAGKDAPVFDLCNATVEGTNLFCQDHVTDDQGNPIERVQMPQLATKDPQPGSVADGLPRNQFGEVDMSGQFAKFLSQTGRPPVETTIDAKLLRASQDELNGAKVAGIADAIASGDFDPTTGRIWVTNDNYVIDGHHRWAATVAEEYATGTTIDIPVRRLDMDIGTALTTATYWTEEMGIAGAGLTAKRRTVIREDPLTVAEARLMLGLAELGIKFDDSQPRDDHGRWTSGGGGEPATTFQEQTAAWADQHLYVQPYLHLTQKIAVQEYTRTGWEHINSALRREGGALTDANGNSLTDIEQRDVSKIAVAIDSSPLPEDLVLWRGASELPAGMRPGVTFYDQAFTSASLSRDVADSFAGQGYSVRIEAPAGTKALYTGSMDATSHDEAEVLLGRAQPFTVQSIDETTRVVSVRAGRA